MSDPSSPDFGPRGYLPDRASKRARKIVLRAPMGVQWVVASALFAVTVLVAGLVWLGSAGGPPGPPFVRAGQATTAEPTVTGVGDPHVWLVTGAGPVLAAPAGQADDLRWCEASGRLESGDGRVWTATGRGLGTASLTTHPVRVHDDTAYVDPTTEVEGPRPADEAADPAC